MTVTMTTSTKVAPDPLYYAIVDGTSEVDSVAFAKNLTLKRGFGGWRNLLDFLQPDPYEPTRLLDGAHIYLPIIKLDEKARADAGGVAVICPGGPGGRGIEESWKTYDPAPRAWKATPPETHIIRTTYGRFTAGEESAAMVEDFLLTPVVQIDPLGVASIRSDRPTESGARLFRASLLYVSSHGWLGGFMAGESFHAWPAAEPEVSRKGGFYPYHSYFLVGRADKEGRAFRGPQWIVLAQCSTMNSATWAMWTRLMARSDPPVRGLLGYEESSPAAGASIGIANRFFEELRGRRTFLEAWRAANKGQHWAAIVHKDAHQDTLTAFPRDRLPAATLNQYIGYLRSVPGGEVISDPPPPFSAQLFRIKHAGTPQAEESEVTPDTLDRWRAQLSGAEHRDYRVRITATQPFVHAAVRFVHIRDTYREQFRPRQLFANAFSPTAGAELDDAGPQYLNVRLKAPVTSVDIRLTAHGSARLGQTGLSPDHSYLWLAATIRLVAGAELKHAFKTTGLLYFG